MMMDQIIMRGRLQAGQIEVVDLRGQMVQQLRERLVE
jgi:hypothetical protein